MGKLGWLFLNIIVGYIILTVLSNNMSSGYIWWMIGGSLELMNILGWIEGRTEGR